MNQSKCGLTMGTSSILNTGLSFLNYHIQQIRFFIHQSGAIQQILKNIPNTFPLFNNRMTNDDEEKDRR